MKVKKWAQMTPEERAWERVTEAKGVNKFGYGNNYPESFKDRQYYRERNRYYQLLNHWCVLKKERESRTTASSYRGLAVLFDL